MLNCAICTKIFNSFEFVQPAQKSEKLLCNMLGGALATAPAPNRLLYHVSLKKSIRILHKLFPTFSPEIVQLAQKQKCGKLLYKINKSYYPYAAYTVFHVKQLLLPHFLVKLSNFYVLLYGIIHPTYRLPKVFNNFIQNNKSAKNKK